MGGVDRTEQQKYWQQKPKDVVAVAAIIVEQNA